MPTYVEFELERMHFLSVVHLFPLLLSGNKWRLQPDHNRRYFIAIHIIITYR